jgi:hypothetical protein
LPDPGHHDARGLSELLAEHARTVRSERVSLADIADFLGTRSIGAWLLFLALPMALPVPMPGISILFGVPLMIISVQLALGRRRAWLPASVLRRSVGRTDYVALVARMQPALERFERLVRPRASLLASDWAKVPVGVTCFVLAAIITLPIPLGPRAGHRDLPACSGAYGARRHCHRGRICRRRACFRDRDAGLNGRSERLASLVYRLTIGIDHGSGRGVSAPLGGMIG